MMQEYEVPLKDRGPLGPQGPVAPPPGGGDNDPMEPRVKALEDMMATVRDRLTKIETRLEHMPTTAQLHQEISSQTWKLVSWVTGISGLLVAATYFIAKHVS